ncbi:MAG: MotA/TolQ/ExbB proton channel family protein [Lentisphaeria bacterium]|nr:MotA/TolQ/ExbB proton channel family protein [Lentisphaeria bacterium]
MWETVTNYSQAGGPIVLVLCFSSFVIWFTYFYALVHFRERLKNSDIELVLNNGVAVSGLTYRLVEFVKGNHQNRNVSELLEEAKSKECHFFFGGFKVMQALVLSASLCGLLGTVLGMIETFDVVAAVGTTSELVAAGISKALVTTQAGLVVALLGSLALAHLNRLVSRINHLFDSHEVLLISIYGEKHETA